MQSGRLLLAALLAAGAGTAGLAAPARVAQLEQGSTVDPPQEDPAGGFPADAPAAGPAPRPGVSSYWTHNGSVVALRAEADRRSFVYEEPRPGIAEQGARPGTVLFEGRLREGGYSGTSWIFSARCGARPFEVSGEVSPDSRRIVMGGRAPLLAADCAPRGFKDVTLEFDYLSRTR